MASADVFALVVRQPDATNQTVGDERGHRAPGVCQRYTSLVGPVQQVHVEVVPTDSPQAHLARHTHLVRPEATAAAAALRPRCNLGTDKESVRHLAQRGTDHRLIAGIEVILGRIDPVDTKLIHGTQHC